MTIFFDLDDTLYDRGTPFLAAADEFFGGNVADPRKAYRHCMFRGNEVYLPSQRGEITMEEMFIYRWSKGFSDVGIQMTPEEALAFQELYCFKKDSLSLSPVVENLLCCCAENADGLGIITNGPSQNQWNKLNRLNLERFIDRKWMIVSGDVGIDKPDPKIFRIAEQRSHTSPKDLLYVGDSLENDIAPASRCGWKTIWFNRNETTNNTDILPSITVTTETDLASAIKNILY